MRTDMSVPKARARRKRRTYLRGPDQRAQILQVAKAVFAARGYHAANVAHICKDARIGRGTLYQYFDNKRAVMLSLLEDLAATVKRVIDERPRVGEIPGPVSVPPALVASDTRRRVRVLLDAIFQDEQTLRLVLHERRGLDDAADRIIQRRDETMLRAVARAVQGEQHTDAQR